MNPNPQISEFQFFFKLSGIGIAWLIFLLYFVTRSFSKGRRFVIAPQLSERDFVEQGKFTIKELQQGPWQINAEKSINYASISLSTLILATIFIFEQRLTGYDAIMFNIMLAVFAISTLAYFVGLQFWFLALDAGGSNYSRIQYRRIATFFQSIGWLALQLAGMLAVMAVNTILGYIISFLGIGFLVLVIEYKLKVTVDEQHIAAEMNDFQKQIDQKGIIVKDQEDFSPAVSSGRDSFRVMSWNIERGYKPEVIAGYINQLDPDIVCLQEVDWGNERTAYLDILDYLAQKTGMRGLFSPEFFEIQTPYRTAKTAGGGVHGNAFLLKFDYLNYFRIDLPKIFDWENPPPQGKSVVKREKRLGSRFALCVDVECFGEQYTICSAHLEDKGGNVDGRRSQLHYLIAQLNARNPECRKIIAGDMNTIGNWITQLIGVTKPSISKRWHESECQWWRDSVLPELGYFDPFSCSDWTLKQGWFYREKLDWILLDRNIQTIGHGIGDFNSSDHRPIWVDIQL